MVILSWAILNFRGRAPNFVICLSQTLPHSAAGVPGAAEGTKPADGNDAISIQIDRKFDRPRDPGKMLNFEAGKRLHRRTRNIGLTQQETPGQWVARRV